MATPQTYSWNSNQQFLSPQQRSYQQPNSQFQTTNQQPGSQFQVTHQQQMPSNQGQMIGTINTYKQIQPNLLNQQNQQQQFMTPSNAVPAHVHQYMVSNQQQRIEPLQQEVISSVQEVHHMERPLQVVAVDDFETKWKTKCFKLEQIIYDLQVELQKYKNTQPKEITQYVYDDARVKELEARIRQYVMNENDLNRKIGEQEEEIGQWKDRYNKAELMSAKGRGLDEQIRQLQAQLDDMSTELEESNSIISKKDSRIVDLENQLQDKQNDVDGLIEENDQLQTQLQQSGQSEARITQLVSEAESWKKRFRDSNQELSKAQEELELTKANLDALKKQGTTTTVVKETKETTLRASGLQKSGDGTTAVRSSAIRNSQIQQ